MASTTAAPVVLTAIPTFNAAHFLPATLEALASQTRRPDRVVVLDNGSTDATEAIVRGHPTLRMEFRRHAENVGVLGNLNRCLALAPEADYLHLLMADDRVRPTFYERCVPALEGMAGQAFSYVADDKINQHGRVVIPAPAPVRPGPRVVPTGEFLRRQATLETVLLPGVLFRTSRRPMPATFGAFPQLADGVFLAELAHLGLAVVEVPEVLCEYRISNINASARHRSSLETFVRDEWRAMSRVAGWIPEPAWRRPWTRAVLRLRFAARTEVKRQLFAAANPAYASEVDAVRREVAGVVLGTLGVAAVRARDMVRRLRGQPTRLQQFESLQES